MAFSTIGNAVVVVGVVTALLVISALAATTTLAVRGVRRRYRALRSRLQVVGVPTSSRTELPAVRAVAAATIGSPAWWRVQRDRHRT